MRRLVIVGIACLAAAPAAGAATPSRLGTPETVVSLAGDAGGVTSAVSHDGRLPAVIQACR